MGNSAHRGLCLSLRPSRGDVISNTIQTQIYSVGQTFGVPGAENIQMTSHAPWRPVCSRRPTRTRFRKDLLRNILMYLQAAVPATRSISRSRGSGKTTPSTSSHGTRCFGEVQDLIGHHTLVSEKPGEPATHEKWSTGPGRGHGVGSIFIFNEIDLSESRA